MKSLLIEIREWILYMFNMDEYLRDIEPTISREICRYKKFKGRTITYVNVSNMRSDECSQYIDFYIKNNEIIN